MYSCQGMLTLTYWKPGTDIQPNSSNHYTAGLPEDLNWLELLNTLSCVCAQSLVAVTTWRGANHFQTRLLSVPMKSLRKIQKSARSSDAISYVKKSLPALDRDIFGQYFTVNTGVRSVGVRVIYRVLRLAIIAIRAITFTMATADSLPRLLGSPFSKDFSTYRKRSRPFPR